MNFGGSAGNKKFLAIMLHLMDINEAVWSRRKPLPEMECLFCEFCDEDENGINVIVSWLELVVTISSVPILGSCRTQQWAQKGQLTFSVKFSKPDEFRFRQNGDCWTKFQVIEAIICLLEPSTK